MESITYKSPVREQYLSLHLPSHHYREERESDLHFDDYTIFVTATYPHYKYSSFSFSS